MVTWINGVNLLVETTHETWQTLGHKSCLAGLETWPTLYFRNWSFNNKYGFCLDSQQQHNGSPKTRVKEADENISLMPIGFAAVPPHIQTGESSDTFLSAWPAWLLGGIGLSSPSSSSSAYFSTATKLIDSQRQGWKRQMKIYPSCLLALPRFCRIQTEKNSKMFCLPGQPSFWGPLDCHWSPSSLASSSSA